MSKIAVILFNLGGPDNLKSVKPFLFNLFTDENIIRLPWFGRYPLAWLISTLRNKKACDIYKKLGGKSPINQQTYAQSDAVEKVLKEKNTNNQYKIFTAMRYWHPMTHDMITDVQDYDPDYVILLPLYPQLSTTTTKSSFEEWDKQAKKINFNVKTTKICCYPEENGFVSAYADLIQSHLAAIPASTEKVKILFSAHGIPQDCVDDGDPYEEQIKCSVDKIMDKLREKDIPFAHQITYQSKVGPKKWLEPDTESAIETLSEENYTLCIVPIAFVSEHSETLVELDMDYKELAMEKGAKDYIRVPTVATHPDFIKGLADMVLVAENDNPKDCGKKCSKKFTECHKRRFGNTLRF